MAQKNANSTRAGRSIVNLEDGDNVAATHPGAADTGTQMPKYKDDVRQKKATKAVEHLQVSAIADIAEDGEVTQDESEKEPRSKTRRGG